MNDSIPREVFKTFLKNCLPEVLKELQDEGKIEVVEDYPNVSPVSPANQHSIPVGYPRKYKIITKE